MCASLLFIKHILYSLRFGLLAAQGTGITI